MRRRPHHKTRLVVGDVEGVASLLGGRLQDGVGLGSPRRSIAVRLSTRGLLVNDELGEDALSEDAEPAEPDTRV